MIPLMLIAGILVLSVLVPPDSVTGFDPVRTDTALDNASPSSTHPFGTDHLGRDVLARVIAATRIDLGIAVVATFLAFGIGVVLGAAAGFAGGAVDGILMRVLEILQSIPGILLGLLIMVLAGSGFVSLVLAITLINIPVYARLTRAEIQPLAHSPVVAAANLSMVPKIKILLVYVLPSALTSAIAYLPVQAGFSISVAAGFGFIGVGIQPPQAEWGTMIREGLSGLIFLDVWWPVLFPALYLAASVLILYKVGNLLIGRFS
jgi:peptide/nickel transport system permease protein